MLKPCGKGHNNWSTWTSTNGTVHKYCKTCRQERAKNYSQRKKNTHGSHTEKEFQEKLKQYEKCPSCMRLWKDIPNSKGKARYIHSASEPYTEEQEISQDRVDAWLEHFGMHKFQSHCSGHARGRDLLDTVKEVNAKTLYPIHTEHPEIYQKISLFLIRNYVQRHFAVPVFVIMLQDQRD